MTHSAKQIAEQQGYDSVIEYFESLILEYTQGNKLAASAEFGQLRHDSQQQFLKFCDNNGFSQAYDFFHQFI